MRLSYDHISVKRWLRGGISRHSDIVADVLSTAWGIPVPQHVIWPELRDGVAPIPAHLQAWTPGRTLEDLAAFIGSDMLTRREILAGTVGVATGSTLLTPIVRWLDIDPIGLRSLYPDGNRPAGEEPDRHIGDTDVQRIEDSIRILAGQDAQTGGGLSREAAVGQLKYAADLVRYATYTDPVGNRLLTAVAGLAGLAGWMSLDSGMAGPAQRYLLYGLQAARESTDPRAPLLGVRLLADLAQHQRWTGHHTTSVRLFDLALNRLPAGTNQFNLTRGNILANKAHSLAHLGTAALLDVRTSLDLAQELHTHRTEEERETIAVLPHRDIDNSETALAAQASCAYIVLGRAHKPHAASAEAPTMFTLTHKTAGHGRNSAQAHIRLAQLRFISGEAEEGCEEARQALVAAGTTESSMVAARIRELLTDTSPYTAVASVRDLREQLVTAFGTRSAPSSF